MQRICKHLELNYKAGILEPTSQSYVFGQEHHLLGGNRLKFSAPDTPIVYRADWQQRVSNWDSHLFFLLGGRMMEKKLGLDYRAMR
jgi:hypothetical protein